jgi:hypothetical protein
MGRQCFVAHRINARVHHPQTAVRHAEFDLALAEPHVGELPSRHDSVLSRGEVAHLPIDWQ